MSIDDDSDVRDGEIIYLRFPAKAYIIIIVNMKIELNKSEVEYIVSGLEELCESDLEETEYEEIGKIIEKLEA